jgi:anti-anti-sigma regulatory factor
MGTFWHRLTRIPYEQPGQRERWLYHATLVASIAAAIVKLASWGANLPQELSTTAPTKLVLSALRPTLVLTVAFWLLAWRPRRSLTPLAARRAEMLSVISVILFGVVAMVMLIDVGNLVEHGVLSFYLTLLALTITLYWTVRRGAVTVGAVIVTVTLAAQAVDAAVEAGQLSQAAAPFLATLAILSGGLLVQRWFGALVAVALPLLIITAQRDVRPLNTVGELVMVVMLAAITGFVSLYASSLEQALRVSEQRGAELRTAQQDLASQNAVLHEQSAALEQIHAQLKDVITQQEQHIATAVDALRQRSVELHTIQTPLIRVASGVAVLPLVGSWNAERRALLREQALGQIEQLGLRRLIIDTAGVSVADHDFARFGAELVQAARLMGCGCVLSGVSPATAEALVQMQFELTSGTFTHDLAAALAAPAR